MKGANITAQLTKMSPTKELTEIIWEIREAQEYRIRHKDLRLQMELPLEVSAMPMDVRNELRYRNKTGAYGPIIPLMSLATDGHISAEGLSSNLHRDTHLTTRTVLETKMPRTVAI